MLHSCPHTLLDSSALVLETTPSFGIRFSYNHFAWTQTACMFDEACLPRRCLAVDSILSRAYAERYLPGSCVTVGCLLLRAHVLREFVYQAVT
jgi:hypothetical protein